MGNHNVQPSAYTRARPQQLNVRCGYRLKGEWPGIRKRPRRFDCRKTIKKMLTPRDMKIVCRLREKFVPARCYRCHFLLLRCNWFKHFSRDVAGTCMLSLLAGKRVVQEVNVQSAQLTDYTYSAGRHFSWVLIRTKHVLHPQFFFSCNLQRTLWFLNWIRRHRWVVW